MFLAVRDLAPQLLPFVISAYGSPSSMFFGDRVIESREGVQHGDHLGLPHYSLKKTYSQNSASLT